MRVMTYINCPYFLFYGPMRSMWTRDHGWRAGSITWWKMSIWAPAAFSRLLEGREIMEADQIAGVNWHSFDKKTLSFMERFVMGLLNNNVQTVLIYPPYSMFRNQSFHLHTLHNYVIHHSWNRRVFLNWPLNTAPHAGGFGDAQVNYWRSG